MLVRNVGCELIFIVGCWWVPEWGERVCARREKPGN